MPWSGWVILPPKRRNIFAFMPLENSPVFYCLFSPAAIGPITYPIHYQYAFLLRIAVLSKDPFSLCHLFIVVFPSAAMSLKSLAGCSFSVQRGVQG